MFIVKVHVATLKQFEGNNTNNITGLVLTSTVSWLHSSVIEEFDFETIDKQIHQAVGEGLEPRIAVQSATLLPFAQPQDT